MLRATVLRGGNAPGQMKPRRGRATKLAAFSLAFLVVIGVVAAGATNAAANREGDGNAKPATELRIVSFQDLADLPFVTKVSEGLVNIDMTHDPALAHRALGLAQDRGLLEDVTVQISGVQSLSADEQRRADFMFSSLDEKSLAPRCPDRPTGQRSTDKTTVPTLGCDEATGGISRGYPVGGPLDASLASAFEAVVASYLPGLKGYQVKVIVDKGAVAADFSAGFFDAARQLPNADSYRLSRDLLQTAHSNGAVKTVVFTVGGDCLKYAIAVGGDVCSSEDFS